MSSHKPNGDAAFVAANERRREILRLLPQLNNELKRLEIFIETWCDMVGVPRPQKPARAARGPRSPNMPRAEVVRECLAILSECGRPLSRKELLAALSKRGVEICGKDPTMVLSTMLWRSQDQIVRTTRGYMALRDSDGTATAAANGDLPVPKDCQARPEGNAQTPLGSSPKFIGSTQ